MGKIFAGVSAFPLTPLRDDRLDESAFRGLMERLSRAGVDSITALGSTGSYPYLSRGERARVARLAVEHAGDVPVFVGVGALRTSTVLTHIADAEAAGAAGVLLPPLSYQPLDEDDVFGLYRTVTDQSSLPVIVYDNPATTHFRFTTALYARIAALPGIASIKIPAVPTDPGAAAARVAEVRAVIPDHVTIGVSGDPSAATGLNAGCDGWYSVLAGTVPAPAVAIVRSVREGRSDDALAESARLAPLWELFAEFGSYRVIAAVAERMRLVPDNCLPLPIRGLSDVERARVADAVEALGFE